MRTEKKDHLNNHKLNTDAIHGKTVGKDFAAEHWNSKKHRTRVKQEGGSPARLTVEGGWRTDTQTKFNLDLASQQAKQNKQEKVTNKATIQEELVTHVWRAHKLYIFGENRANLQKIQKSP